MADDFIKREDALKAATLAELDADFVIEAIHRIPAADVRPVRRGKWLDDPTNSKRKVCNCCGILHLIAQYPHGNINYCPNCGADMREAHNG